jgi:hypothetical protein
MTPVHLDTRGEAAGVRAFALHPGSILTRLQRHIPTGEMVAAGWIDEAGNLADPRFKTREQGAATAVWAATSPQLAGMGGLLRGLQYRAPGQDRRRGGRGPACGRSREKPADSGSIRLI